MNRNWLTGTALAAVLAASPALAQDTASCLLEGEDVTQVSLTAIDANGDGEISRDEYRACLEANVNDETAREANLATFDEMAGGEDGVKAALPALPIQFGAEGARPGLRQQPPRLGQHNREVLQSSGFSSDDIAELESTGAIISAT